jgi:hypothetical protein
METQILTPQVYDLLIAAEKPAMTTSYHPMGHGELIDYVKERVDKMGLKVVNERYSINKGAQQMFGEMAISCEDEGLRWALGFRNSYDKSLPVGFVAGAQVIVCSNLMLRGDVRQVRKHTTNILKDIDTKFDLIQKNIDDNFNKLKKEVVFYKEQELTYDHAAQLYGKILMKHSDVATVQQVTKAIQLFKEPIHGFGNDTAWGFVNTFTEVFKEVHPWLGPKQYLNLREFVNNEFKYSEN